MNLERLIGLKEKYDLPKLTPLIIKYSRIYQAVKRSRSYRFKDGDFHKEISYNILENQLKIQKGGK